MEMPRLTAEAVPKSPSTFLQCQLCQETFTDICKVHIWQECDEKDVPEERFLVVCRDNPSCKKKIDDHPRAYHQKNWGVGNAGQFVLLCGDCSWRKEWSCTNPKLEANGGEGLTVHFQPAIVGNITVCTTKGRYKLPWVATRCEGLPEEHERYMAAPESKGQ
jgi:hypothetical protein